jgi:hypothetical protein
MKTCQNPPTLFRLKLVPNDHGCGEEVDCQVDTGEPELLGGEQGCRQHEIHYLIKDNSEGLDEQVHLSEVGQLLDQGGHSFRRLSFKILEGDEFSVFILIFHFVTI